MYCRAVRTARKPSSFHISVSPFMCVHAAATSEFFRFACLTPSRYQSKIWVMEALAGIRRFKAIFDLLLATVRQSGNGYRTSACATTVLLRLQVNSCTRVPSIGVHTRRWLSGPNGKPEVDYSRAVSVIREGGMTSSYNAIWLRENCPCDACYDADTCQRVVAYYRLPPEAFVESHVTWVSEEGVVEVTWRDRHQSR